MAGWVPLRIWQREVPMLLDIDKYYLLFPATTVYNSVTYKYVASTGPYTQSYHKMNDSLDVELQTTRVDVEAHKSFIIEALFKLHKSTAI